MNGKRTGRAHRPFNKIILIPVIISVLALITAAVLLLGGSDEDTSASLSDTETSVSEDETSVTEKAQTEETKEKDDTDDTAEHNPDGKAEVPDFIGIGKNEAVELAHGCGLAVKFEYEKSSAENIGKVVGQSIKKNKSVWINTEITLFIGTHEEETAKPDEAAVTETTKNTSAENSAVTTQEKPEKPEKPQKPDKPEKSETQTANETTAITIYAEEESEADDGPIVRDEGSAPVETGHESSSDEGSGSRGGNEGIGSRGDPERP